MLFVSSPSPYQRKECFGLRGEWGLWFDFVVVFFKHTNVMSFLIPINNDDN